MSGTFVYLPILKWKQGEQLALRYLDKADRDRILPLIEVLQVPSDDETGKQVSPVKNHLDKAAKKLKNWGKQRPIAVDLANVPGRAEGGTSSARYFFARARAEGYLPLPVLAITADGSFDATTVDGVPHNNGVVFRVRIPSEGADRVQDNLKAALATTSLQAGAVHLVLDLWGIEGTGASALAETVKAVVLQARGAGTWRSVILAGGSFPYNLTGLRQGAQLLDRVEWDLWRMVAVDPDMGVLYFGDYAVTHPAPSPELDPRTINATAAIRYARPKQWLLLKARSVKQFGFQQYNDLCRLLVASSDYDGPSFSWGDARYAEHAKPSASSGSLMTWRRDATNHHLALAARACASLCASAAPL